MTFDAKVEYIDKAIDTDSPSAKFRTSIPNPEGRLKAAMFVKVLLEIPPKPGQTVIPRGAMVSVDRVDYVFVKQSGKTPSSSPAHCGGQGEQRLGCGLQAQSRHPGVEAGRRSGSHRQPDSRAITKTG